MKQSFSSQQKIRDEFNRYLRALTDKQVVNVFRKERRADRKLEASLAAAEIRRRGINMQEHPYE